MSNLHSYSLCTPAFKIGHSTNCCERIIYEAAKCLTAIPNSIEYPFIASLDISNLLGSSTRRELNVPRPKVKVPRVLTTIISASSVLDQLKIA